MEYVCVSTCVWQGRTPFHCFVEWECICLAGALAGPWHACHAGVRACKHIMQACKLGMRAMQACERAGMCPAGVPAGAGLLVDPAGPLMG